MKKIKPYYYLIIIALIIFSWYMIPYLKGFAIGDTSCAKVVTEVSGYLRCEYAGSPIKLNEGTFDKCWFDEKKYLLTYCSSNGNCGGTTTDFCGAYTKWIECPSSAGNKGCFITLYNFDCKDILSGTGKNIPSKYYKKGTGNWQSFTDTIRLEGGENVQIRLRCNSDAGLGTSTLGYNKYPTWNTPTYTLNYYPRQINLLGSDYAKQGTISSSYPDCKWVSSDTQVQNLADIQRSGKINIVGSLPIDSSVPITVALRESSGFNINPLGSYNGQDVICQVQASGNALYEAKLYKAGTCPIFTQGNLIKKGLDVCCGGSNSGCSGDMKCVAYKCEAQPACGGDQCYSWQAGQKIDESCVDKSGSKFLVGTYCSNAEPSCKEEKIITGIACCPSDCLSGQYCDRIKGCVVIADLDPCPQTRCCLEGNTKFKTQSCASNLECCLADDNDNDQLTGLCQSSCSRIIENCNDKIDNDDDGLIDEKDPECQVSCETRCAGGILCEAECVFGKYAIYYLIGIVAGIIALVVFIARRKRR